MTINFAALEAESLDFWQELWDGNLTPYENTHDILSRCVALPYQDTQLPIAIVYSWLNQKWSRELPIMFSVGPEGSGKSTVGTFARHLHGVETQGVNSTAVAIRNYLNEMRWAFDDEDETYNYNAELDGALLVFDNVYTDTFTSDKNLTGMLLTGHKRGNDAIRIGDKGGKSIVFYTFAPKWITSIEPIWEDPKLKELRRRMVVLFHQQWERMNDDEKPDFDWDNVINLDNVCWDGFSSKIFFPFWTNEDTAHRYLAAKRSYNSCKKPECFTQARKPLCADMVATGVVIGAWKDSKEGIARLGNYWDYLDDKFSQDSDALRQFLREFIGDKDIVAVNDIKVFIDFKFGKGQLLSNPKGRDIMDHMRALGFINQKANFVKL